MGTLLEVATIKFDKMKNRLVVITGNGDKIEIDPVKIIEEMPKKNKAEQIEDLQTMIFYIEKQQFAQVQVVLAKVVETTKGIAESREKLKKCEKTVCVKKWQAVSKTYVDEKNNMKELRLTINILEKKKAELRTKIAKFEMGGQAQD